MKELNVTWGRASQIWWALTWRGFLLVILPSFIVGAILGFFFAVNRISVQEHEWLFRSIGLIIGVPLAILVIKIVFSTSFGSFRIAIISLNEDLEHVPQADRPISGGPLL